MRMYRGAAARARARAMRRAGRTRESPNYLRPAGAWTWGALVARGQAWRGSAAAYIRQTGPKPLSATSLSSDCSHCTIRFSQLDRDRLFVLQDIFVSQLPLRLARLRLSNPPPGPHIRDHLHGGHFSVQQQTTTRSTATHHGAQQVSERGETLTSGKIGRNSSPQIPRMGN